MAGIQKWASVTTNLHNERRGAELGRFMASITDSMGGGKGKSKGYEELWYWLDAARAVVSLALAGAKLVYRVHESDPRSSNGRTTAFGAVNRGSNPRRGSRADPERGAYPSRSSRSHSS